MITDRRRLMMAIAGGGGAPATWQEYPVECWGLGNWWTGYQPEGYERYANLIYWQAPLLSPSVYIENNSEYNCSLRWLYSDLSSPGDTVASATGEYTAPAGVVMFTAIIWDRPPLSIVNSGLFKMYYRGQPYPYPTQKPTMKGSDYLWCVGNLNNGVLNEAYPNCCVRELQPIQTRLMDVDLTQCSYNLTLHLFDSSKSWIYRNDYYAGNAYADILANFPSAEYYNFVLWDQPVMSYARAVPFEIKFEKPPERVELPAGFTQYDYIVCNSWGDGSYIDSGISDQSSGVKVEFRYMNITTTPNGNGFFGTLSGWIHDIDIIFHAPAVAYGIRWVDALDEFKFGMTGNAIGQRHTVECGDGYITIDGVTGSTVSDSGNTLGGNLLFLRGHDNNTEDPVLYYKLWINGTLVRHMIPCTNSNNEPGMYDLVSEAFFGNAGSGSLVVGNF